jgi:hypothetical protein
MNSSRYEMGMETARKQATSLNQASGVDVKTFHHWTEMTSHYTQLIASNSTLPALFSLDGRTRFPI